MLEEIENKVRKFNKERGSFPFIKLRKDVYERLINEHPEYDTQGVQRQIYSSNWKVILETDSDDGIDLISLNP